MIDRQPVAEPRSNLGGMRYALLEKFFGTAWRMFSMDCQTQESVADTLKDLESLNGLTVAGKTGIKYYSGASLKGLGLVIDTKVGVQKLLAGIVQPS